MSEKKFDRAIKLALEVWCTFAEVEVRLLKEGGRINNIIGNYSTHIVEIILNGLREID